MAGSGVPARPAPAAPLPRHHLVPGGRRQPAGPANAAGHGARTPSFPATPQLASCGALRTLHATYVYAFSVIRSQVCTVLLAVEPPLVRLGDTDVGRVKTADVLVRNLSELPARVQLK